MSNPVGDPECLDIVGRRKDGGVDLIVVAAKRLDASHATREALLQKLANYLEYARGEEFADEFGADAAVTIILNLRGPSDPAVDSFISERIVPWLSESGVRLKVVESR